MLQAPWFAGMTVKPHWIAVVECSRMTAGDAMITLFAFWGAAVVGGRRWFVRRRASAWSVYLGIGLLATIVLEWLSTEVWKRWAYAPGAPRLPGLGTGIVPLLQWLLLPPLVAWLAAGQIRGHPERPLSKE